MGGLNASSGNGGLTDGEVHTMYSHNAELAAVNAFSQYLFLMDAAGIIRPNSTFSGTVCHIRGLKCESKPVKSLPTEIFVCLPDDC